MPLLFVQTQMDQLHLWIACMQTSHISFLRRLSILPMQEGNTRRLHVSYLWSTLYLQVLQLIHKVLMDTGQLQSEIRARNLIRIILIRILFYLWAELFSCTQTKAKQCVVFQSLSPRAISGLQQLQTPMHNARLTHSRENEISTKKSVKKII